MNITEIKIELNRQKSGKQSLKAESIVKDGSMTTYIFQGKTCRAVFTVTERDRIRKGQIKVELDNEPFRENDNLALLEPVKIEVSFDQTPDSMTAMHLYRDWWTYPAFISTFEEMPERTQSLYMKTAEGTAYLLPMAGDVYKTYACPGEPGVLTLAMTAYQGGKNLVDETVFYLSTGQQIYEAVELAFAQAAKDKHLPLRKDREYPEMFDYLGWCSWDAFYTEITESKVREKAEELSQKQIPVRWFLLDDGWHSVHGQRLYDFMPEKEKFPNGFASMIQEIKERTTIDRFGVWHAFGGYWGGIEPGSSVAAEQQDHLYETVNGKLLPHPTAEKGYGFFQSWYDILRAEGIDFVKVDGQSAIKNYYENSQPVCRAAKGTHEALEGASSAYMGGRLINCMGMAMENIWGRPGSGLSRNSDDFVPDNEAGFGKHLIENSYNAVYHNELYHCDWDMFWTFHPDAKKHGILRAVSGGPVYFSDRIGETDQTAIEPLIYRDGRILRMDRAAKPSPDCIFQNPQAGGLLKITNLADGGDGKKAGAVAVYNLTEAEGQTRLKCEDVYDLNTGDYLFYQWEEQEGSLVKAGEALPLILEAGSCALYLLIPCRGHITPIGLLDKYISFHGIETVIQEEDGVSIFLKEGGVFGFYAEEEPKSLTVNGTDVIRSQVLEKGIRKVDTKTVEKTVIRIGW